MNLSEVPASGDAAFQDIWNALSRVEELEVAFSVVPFLSIDAVGSGLLAALHEDINGDTLSRASDNSSGKPR